MQRHHRRGFTLIETGVVAALIATLIGILVPAVSKARKASRDVACQTALHGVGNAFETYARGNKDYYPFNDRSVCPGHCNDRVLEKFCNNYAINGKAMVCAQEGYLTKPYNIVTRVENITPNRDQSAQASYTLEPAIQRTAMKSGQRTKQVLKSLDDAKFVPNSAPDPLAYDTRTGRIQPNQSKVMPGQNHPDGGYILYTDAHIEYKPREKWYSRERPVGFGSAVNPWDLNL